MNIFRDFFSFMQDVVEGMAFFASIIKNRHGNLIILCTGQKKFESISAALDDGLELFEN